MKKKYCDKAKLLYSDTNSLIYAQTYKICKYSDNGRKYKTLNM